MTNKPSLRSGRTRFGSLPSAHFRGELLSGNPHARISNFDWTQRTCERKVALREFAKAGWRDLQDCVLATPRAHR
jgi:hypothetical protein